VDDLHGGSLVEAGNLTGVPYPTLNDLYKGRSLHPSIATLELLGKAYDVPVSWFFSDGSSEVAPRTGITVILPPDPRSAAKRRALRKVAIPFLAWSMYAAYAELERHLKGLPVSPDRPIVAEAAGDTLTFRLATFLFQPLLAAEKVGEVSPIQTDLPEDPALRSQWIDILESLGDMWRKVLPSLIGPTTA